MALKSVFAGLVFAVSLVSGGPSRADEYRHDEFLGLDLSKAVLSKKLLGPETQFAPFPIEAKIEPAQAGAEPTAAPKAERGIAASKAAVAKSRVANSRVPKPRDEPRVAQSRGAARTAPARRGNPLDAQARDTRIQVWPCKSGGICDWRR